MKIDVKIFHLVIQKHHFVWTATAPLHRTHT